MKRWFLYSLTLWFFATWTLPSSAQQKGQPGRSSQSESALPGAAIMDAYLPLLKGKRVALVVNQTSRVGSEHLLDTLLKHGIKVVKVFVPEHGFRGTADAGEQISNTTDKQTGLPVVSLYGKNKKPAKEQLKDVDIIVYDLQDVGVRFYTYISTLEYVMQACVENAKLLIVLDRPNPNGHYIDGPVLRPAHRSFVGMQAVPVVYGMTAGEYARMLAGEGWIENADKLHMKIISCRHYDHSTLYELPVPPSPNLKSMAAIYLYPSLCFFEGTVVSVGRGTDKPFQQWGHPDFAGKTKHSFTPQSTTGASSPLYEGKKCFGKMEATNAEDALARVDRKLQLDALITAYRWYPNKAGFFNNFFEKLAGTDELRKMIENGMSADEIRSAWRKDLEAFNQIRKKYLLYQDFE